jgi:ATP-binding cassette, subfamily A (ABC1), member 3
MDAVAKRAFWKIIQEIAPNRSLLLTTHSMEEADTLANRAAIISKRLLAVGTTQALRKKYSNVYYIQLLLKTAPYSTLEEMAAIGAWVRASFPGAAMERETLGGQIRFTVPGSAPVVADGNGNGVGVTGGDVAARTNPIVGLIEMLEREKEDQGIEYYSIGGATLERVFLSVVRENNVLEEDETEKKKPWWKW